MNNLGYRFYGKFIILRIVLIGFLILSSAEIFSQNRTSLSINDRWTFLKSDAAQVEDLNWDGKSTEIVNLPHTWNDKDVLDETPGYYRGGGWYKKSVKLMKGWSAKRVFLEFEAANQQTDIFVNGRKVGSHYGGYSGFRFDITDFLSQEDNNFELIVRVDNSFNEEIPPLTADFTFLGGIYRDAWIIYAPEAHFSLDHFGGPGVYWQTPMVSDKKAEVNVFGFVSDYSSENKKYKVEHIILDQDGRLIHQESFNQSFEKGVNLPLKKISFCIKNPELWPTTSPISYSLVSRLYDVKSGDLLDEEVNPIGFRWFEFSADKGFFLNGESQKIRGISRHQDYPGIGNALNSEQHTEDLLSIKDMGANFLRIAHYPQDQGVISGCDSLGILSSVEIPIVNLITESEKFSENCLMMMEEMIWQNYNHPSLIMWTYMNEVLLRPPLFDEPERVELYFSNVAKLAEKLEKKARELDPYRYTMIPNHGAFSRYNDVGLAEIPMLVGWNLYNGWYSSSFDGFGKFLDNHHLLLPNKPLLVTEYGAGHDPRLTSFDPERFDFTAEYSMLYHKAYVEEIEKRDFVAGSMIWILNDFSSEERIDAVPHINSKGICSVDREPKETFWFYKSIWSEVPFVKIWTPFPGIVYSTKEENNNNDQKVHTVKIYTNAQQIEIILNGEKLGMFQSKLGLIEADLALLEGENILQAAIPETEINEILKFNYLTDHSFIDRVSGIVNLRVSCGDHRYFWDDEKSELWLPDREYKLGNWGYTDGEAFTLKTRHGVKPSSDQQIIGTSIDPVFQTQRISPGSYKFDIPDGKYEVKLLFAELNTADEIKNLAYNLGDDVLSYSVQTREFSVEINEDEVIKSLNLFEKYGAFQSLEKTYEIEVSGNAGLNIKFNKNIGDPVISGIVIRNRTLN